jgi:hypothetical protein
MAEALQWVSRITTVALMVLLPILGGGKLDEMRETKYWGPVGLVLGLVIGAWQLRRIVVDLQRVQDRARGPKATGESQPPRPESKPTPPAKTTKTEDPAESNGNSEKLDR